MLLFASRKTLEKMDNATLDRKSAPYAKMRRWGSKIASPISFFSLLAIGTAFSFIAPAGLAGATLLLTMCSAAFASAGLQFIGGTVTKDVQEIKTMRANVWQAAQNVPALFPEGTTAAPAVAALPDLGEAFHRGVENASTMKPLRLKTGVQHSSFLT